jgi:aminoglycoside phosphotransferase (APT) family kinase protein
MRTEEGGGMKPTSAERPQGLSERLGPWSRVHVQGALDRFNLSQLTSGLFGQNVFLTAESGEWLLRGAPHWPWQFAKERFFAERLHRSTAAPGPRPYLVGASEDTFGWSYALMPKLSGAPPSELRDQLGPDGLREVARAMGADESPS